MGCEKRGHAEVTRRWLGSRTNIVDLLFRYQLWTPQCGLRNDDGLVHRCSSSCQRRRGVPEYDTGSASNLFTYLLFILSFIVDIYIHIVWQRGSEIRTSVFGRRTFPAVRPIYGWQMTTEGKLSAMG